MGNLQYSEIIVNGFWVLTIVQTWVLVQARPDAGILVLCFELPAEVHSPKTVSCATIRVLVIHRGILMNIFEAKLHHLITKHQHMYINFGDSNYQKWLLIDTLQMRCEGGAGIWNSNVSPMACPKSRESCF
jgi:hypothetical protein